MVKNGMNIRRKNRLIILINGYSRIGPPKESLRNRRWIVEFTFNFQISFARVQGKSGHSFLVEHFFVFAHPNSHATIGIMLNSVVDRQKCAGTVVPVLVKL